MHQVSQATLSESEKGEDAVLLTDGEIEGEVMRSMDGWIGVSADALVCHTYRTIYHDFYATQMIHSRATSLL